MKNKMLQKGFTLIELLGVIAIIMILVAIALGVGMALIGTGEEKKTRASMDVIINAIEMYYDENTAYPVDGITTVQLFSLLNANDECKSKLESLGGDTIEGNTFRDAWDTEMKYSLKGLGGNTPQLQSAGPDAKFGNDDDVYSGK